MVWLCMLDMSLHGRKTKFGVGVGVRVHLGCGQDGFGGFKVDLGQGGIQMGLAWVGVGLQGPTAF